MRAPHETRRWWQAQVPFLIRQSTLSGLPLPPLLQQENGAARRALRTPFQPIEEENGEMFGNIFAYSRTFYHIFSQQEAEDAAPACDEGDGDIQVAEEEEATGTSVQESVEAPETIVRRNNFHELS